MGELGGATVFGFTGSIGSLDDKTFSYGGQTHTIDAVLVQLTPNNKLSFGLDAAITDTSHLVLDVDGTPFAFADATFNASNHTYSWTNSAVPTWSANDTVALALTGAAVPGAPTNLTAMPAGGEVITGYRIDLAWTAPTTTGVTIITGYQIEVSDDGGTTWRVLDFTDATPTAFTDTALTVGATHHYRVSAINAAGTGTPSNVAMATAAAPLPASFFKRSLDAPANLEAERTFGDGCIGGNRATPIRLTWDAPALPRSRGGRLVYDYRMKEAAQDSWSDWIQIGSMSRKQIETYQQDGKLDYDVFHFGDLSPEGTSHFQVRVSEVWQKDGSAWSNGAGPWSEASDTAVAGPCVESASPRVSVANPATEEHDLQMLFRVELSRASDQTVTVDYATEAGSATAGVDYEETSGTLIFQPGETKKTIAVRVINDTVEDSGETFKVRLSNAVNAEIWDEVGTGTIFNDEAGVEVDSLTASFENVPESHDGASAFTFELTFSEEFPIGYATLEDAAFEVDGGTVTGARRLEPPGNLRWEITVAPSGNDDVDITLPETTDCTATGAICTDDDRPLSHSLSATVDGPSVTPSVSVLDGSATEGGAVDFTVSLSPASARRVTVEYATSGGTATSGTDFTAASGTVTFAANETSQTVSVATADDSDDEEDETFTLTLSSPNNATLVDATAEGTILDNDEAGVEVDSLTASFENVPESHDGASAFTFELTFSENFPIGYATLEDAAFEVDGGTVTGARRLEPPGNLRWEITVAPSGNDDVDITLPETTDCTEGGAICTDDGRPLSHSLSATVDGPSVTPSVSVSDGSATEGGAVDFTVSLSPASAQQVTVEYATSGGTATSGTDFTAASGTVTFAANETSQTVSVATADDSDDEEDETFTLTLSSPNNATLVDATAEGTILDSDEAASPLTASFSDVPASHAGEEFTFGLTFSEEPALSYRTLRDDAFDVTGGTVRKAERQQQGSNQAWNITVEPSGNDTVAITLPETTDCGATGGSAPADGRPLSHSLSATVAPAASASASRAPGRSAVAVDEALAAAAGVTPDDATAALFGEVQLSEARLAALDRLGNRNGRYDLGDVLSWIERCQRGEARCGTTSGGSGPAAAAALLTGAAAGGRGIGRRRRRRDPGRPGRSPRTRRRAGMGRYALAVLLAAAMTWSCTGGDLTGPPAAAVADPGFLAVEWSGTAASADIGVLIEVEGPGIEAVRAPGYELYQSGAPGPRQIVVAGSLRAGPLVQFRVPDRNQLALYRVRVVEVTGEDYGLRDAGEYRAVITH